MRGFVAFLIALALAGQAAAGLSERDLAEAARVSPPTGPIPASLRFRDLSGQTLTFGEALGGRPALLLPVDYTCRQTCGPALAIVASALRESGLRPGADLSLIVVGIDPRDSLDAARAMTERQVGNLPAIILAGDTPTIASLLSAAGYRAVYDPENDLFAHPSLALALTAEGRVARVLSSLALNPADLRLAMVEAGEGRIGGLTDRLALICYGFDPVHGIYTPLIRRGLALAAAATVALLAASLLLLCRSAGSARGGEGR